MYQPLSDYEEFLAAQVVDIAIKIDKELRPGLLESIYEKCFCIELTNRNLDFVCQKPVSIFYEGVEIEYGLRLDLLIGNPLNVELKAQEINQAVWSAQMLSYLKLSKKRIGFLINFHVPLMKDGTKRRVL